MSRPDQTCWRSGIGSPPHTSAEPDGNLRFPPKRCDSSGYETDGPFRRPRPQRRNWARRRNHAGYHPRPHSTSDTDRLAVSSRRRLGRTLSIRLVQRGDSPWQVHHRLRRRRTEHLHGHWDDYRNQCRSEPRSRGFAGYAHRRGRWRVAGRSRRGGPADLSERDLRGRINTRSGNHHLSQSDRALRNPCGDYRGYCDLRPPHDKRTKRMEDSARHAETGLDLLMTRTTRIQDFVSDDKVRSIPCTTEQFQLNTISDAGGSRSPNEANCAGSTQNSRRDGYRDFIH